MVTLTPAPPDLRTRGTAASHRSDDLSDNSHRQLIGYIGLAMPLLLIVVAALRPTEGLARWEVLGSISAYYYTGATAVFVGLLVALGLFLLTYRGYANDHRWADRAAAVTAGIAALGVALFPTGAPAPGLELAWWSTATGVIHYASAVVLFAMFAVFSLWLFRLTDGSRPSRGKLRRNRVYLACGLLIVGGMIWAGVAGLRGGSIFVPEAIALVAFAISWLVKGRAHRTIGAAVGAVSDAAGGSTD
jgi:NADH:ubiquinone oxidoreductase subunit 6 (subunit J)